MLGTDLRPSPTARGAPGRHEGPSDVVKDRRPKGEMPREGEAAEAVAEAAFLRGCFRRLDQPDALCRFVLRSLCRASGAKRASLMVLDPDRSSLFVKAARGLSPGLVGKVRASLGTGVAGRAVSIGRAVAGRGSIGGPRGYAGSAYVVLPLGTPDAREGVANLTDLPGDRLPGREDLRRLRRLARGAGRALVAARRLEHAEAASATDETTGLPNRRSFGRALRRELERARRSGTGLAVALFDIDRFKAFNDRFGHPVGDRVLAQVARRMASAVRETDLVARWGGEEFAALLTDLGDDAKTEAFAVVERARAAVSARPLSLGAGLPHPSATVSAGVAVFPGDAEQPADLLRRADEALYEAKRGGRDRTQQA